MTGWFIYAFLAMIIQGSLLFIIKILSLNSPPLILLFFQYVGSLICTGIYLVYKKISIKIKREELFKILLSGFLLTTGFSSYYIAISLTRASIVVPVHNVGLTLIPSILAFIFLKEKINARVIFGLISAVLCIILLTSS